MRRRGSREIFRGGGSEGYLSLPGGIQGIILVILLWKCKKFEFFGGGGVRTLDPRMHHFLFIGRISVTDINNF